MAYFDSSAGLVHFEEVGQGEPLIFVHGRTLDSRMWQPQINYFKSKFRCVTYDLNGFGKSDIPKNQYDPAKTLKELIDHLNIKQAFIVGLSLGTYIAINFALDYPKHVKKLILMSCAVPGTTFKFEFKDEWQQVADAGQMGNFKLSKDLWLSGSAFKTLPINNPKNYNLFKLMIDDYTCWDIYNPPVQVSRTDAVNNLKKITAPSLIISGEKDATDFVNNGEILKANLPNAQMVMIKNAGHMVNLEFPDYVNCAIHNFLT
jgi:pimeloyl-ACP methyl ester carboxylesterase